nr:hypothetical protein [Tanacetum cinerariifolium]
SNDVNKLEALVDRKEVVITEAAFRDVLRLDDADGVDCPPNEEIFAKLARMGYEKPVGKGFSGAETPLFKGMLVAGGIEEQGDAEDQVQDNVDDATQGANTAVSGDEVQDQAIPSPTLLTPPPQQPQDLPSTSQLKKREKKLKRANKVKILKLRRLKKVGTSQRIESSADTDMEDASNQERMIADLDRDTGVALMDDKGTEKKAKDAQVAGDEQVKGRQAEIYQIDMDHALKVLSMQEDKPEVQEAVEVVTTAKLIKEVVAAVSESVTAASATTAVVPAATITAALSKDKGKGIMVEEPKPMKKKQQVKMDEEYARKLHEELNKDIGRSVAIDHVKQKAKEDSYMQRYQVMKKRPQTEAQARRNMIMYLKNVAGFRLDYFKGMSYENICPIIKAKFNSNIEFLLKSKEKIEEEENRAIESINETTVQKAAKRRKSNEEVPVVDYQIIQLNNKPHYKIIRADGTHQLYVSFITLLKNFDRKDLESLWSIVKERFSTSKPNNFSDDYLLTTLRATFGRPDGQDQSCGNDLRDGFCSLCNSRNSCVYHPNLNSFDFPPDYCHPPHLTYETYLCDSYGNDSHFGYDCQPQFPLNCGVVPKSDHYQTPQYTVNHPIFNAPNDFLDSQNKITIAQNKIMEQMTQLTSMCEMACQIIQKKQEEKQIKEDQAANARYWKILACCDNDDDYNFAITPNEPIDSLGMGDEYPDTILAMKSDEFIKSSVENLVPNPSESKGENGCDVHACFTTFSNILFNDDYEFDYVNDQSLSDEDFLEKIFLNPLFEEKIIPMKIDQHHFNAESDLIESMLNHDSSIIPSSSKINSLLDEFAGELTLLKSIPLGIDETDCYTENEICFTKRLLYNNSSPRPSEELVSENSNAKIKSFSPSPIPIKDSDSFMEEINLSFMPNDPMPPGIEEDDDDSERDILILEELLDNYSLSLPVNESFHFDIPSFSRPPAKPPDGEIS